MDKAVFGNETENPDGGFCEDWEGCLWMGSAEEIE